MSTAEEFLLANGNDPEILDYGKTINAINLARKELLEELANECEAEDGSWHLTIRREKIIEKITELK